MNDYSSGAVDGLASVHDYEVRARELLPEARSIGAMPPGMWKAIFNDPSAVSYQTTANNIAAFERLQFRPRVLVDVGTVDLTTTAMGCPISVPIIIGGFGHHQRFHPMGECATAIATSTLGTITTVPLAASYSVEEVAASADGALWFQLYVMRDRALTERIVRRVEAAGYRVIVVTVDNGGNAFPSTPLSPTSHHSAPRAGVAPTSQTLDPRRILINLQGEDGSLPAGRLDIDPSFCWREIAWLRKITRLPIIIKGVATAEDTYLCREHGIEGIIVSNHGGLTLSNARPTIETLPEIVAAAGDGLEVYIDGGVRQGTDILTCLALGARAVLIGRAAIWGLIVGGESGVAGVLNTMRVELMQAMRFCGITNVNDVTPSLIAGRPLPLQASQPPTSSSSSGSPTHAC